MVVDPDVDYENYEDRDRSNNVAGLSIFKPELEVAQMCWQAMGPVKRAITVSVKNSGAVPAGNIPVTINKQNSSGTLLLHQETIETLAVGESMDVVFVWDTTGEQTTSGYLKALAEVNKDETIPEPSYINNRRAIRILGALPGAVVNPSIISGATGVSVKPALDWDDVSGATSYDLYIWKQGNPKPGTPTAAGLTESRYIMQESLQALTAYSWQVIAKSSSRETEGPEWTFTTKEILAGDINDDGDVNLTDAILALKIIAGMDTGQTVCELADVNGDGKIGLEEVIYIFQKVSGLRQ